MYKKLFFACFAGLLVLLPVNIFAQVSADWLEFNGAWEPVTRGNPRILIDGNKLEVTMADGGVLNADITRWTELPTDFVSAMVFTDGARFDVIKGFTVDLSDGTRWTFYLHADKRRLTFCPTNNAVERRVSYAKRN